MKLGHNSAKSTLAAVLFAAESRFHGLAGFTSGSCQHHTNAGSADPKCLPYLSPKRYAPADGQTVNLGITFRLFLPCTLHLGNGLYCGMGKSLRRVLCAFLGGSCSFWDLKTNCIFFVRCIVFLVQIAYNDSASRKGMISWLELQQTSASEWTVT